MREGGQWTVDGTEGASSTRPDKHMGDKDEQDHHEDDHHEDEDKNYVNGYREKTCNQVRESMCARLCPIQVKRLDSILSSVHYIRRKIVTNRPTTSR